MSSTETIRRSPIAGVWYPGEPQDLRSMLDGFMARAPAQALRGELRALISPHAGYAYSGQTAAYTYKQVAGKTFETVVIIGPSHFAWFGDFAISAESAYETPFGRVPLAQEWIEELDALLSIPRVRGDREHSIEIQLPFLQHALGSFSFAPILMSADTLAPCVELGQAVARLMRGRNILLVASTDLNHLNSYREVKRRDAVVIRAIERFDLELMADVLLDRSYTVCGRAPILTVSVAAQALGATRVQVLHHTNSGDVRERTDEGTYTVGYLSAAMVQ